MFTYEEAVHYIEEIPKFTTKNKLEHTRKCLDMLGSPDKDRKIIHVAGTNGKGSVCAFLSTMLEEGGFKCGLFTSPHLVKINERFQINEVSIDDDTFLAAFQKVKALSDELVAEGNYHPTYFEMLFLMGMVIFAEAGVDYVTLETGLGGRLDATTAVENPAACVITSISLDHMQYLGNTVAEIAGEKAGIIVPGVPVIYDGNDPEAAAVIKKTAEELGSPSYEVVRKDTRILGNNRDGIDFSMENGYYGDTVFHIPFIARYQVMNAALALTALEVLKDILPAPLDRIREGIAKTRWQGRMETILPGVIVDGAHNEDGICKFVETAAHFQEEYPLTLLFSAVNDKDYPDMIKTICEKIKFRHVVTTQVGDYRQVPSGELAELFCKEGCASVENYDVIEEAFQKALAAKGGDGMLFCVGSLYLVGEIKAALKKQSLRSARK